MVDLEGQKGSKNSQKRLLRSGFLGGFLGGFWGVFRHEGHFTVLFSSIFDKKRVKFGHFCLEIGKKCFRYPFFFRGGVHTGILGGFLGVLAE